MVKSVAKKATVNILLQPGFRVELSLNGSIYQLPDSITRISSYKESEVISSFTDTCSVGFHGISSLCY